MAPKSKTTATLERQAMVEILGKLAKVGSELDPDLKASFEYWEKSSARAAGPAQDSDRLSREDLAIRINTPAADARRATNAAGGGQCF